MSEMVAVGPRLDLTGPRPSPPPHSLLSTPGVVVDRDIGRWLNGVNWIGYPVGSTADEEDVVEERLLVWEPCSDGTFRVKSDGIPRQQMVFDPFVTYLPITCSTLGQYDIQEQAEAVLEASRSLAVERVLAEGLTDGANPYFGDANVTVLGGATESAQNALSYLENAIGATGRQGMIHASPAVVAAWQMFMAAGDQEAGGLRTINGTPVISGGGYIGVETADLAAPAAGQDWAFATGPVAVYLGPGNVQQLRTALDREDNVVTFRAEQYVLATFDPIVQAAVLVDWDV